MIRTCAYLSTFESLINRSPEGLSSGEPISSLPFEPVNAEDINEIIEAIEAFKNPLSLPAFGEWIATVILKKSKEELVAILRKDDEEAERIILESLDSARNHFEARLQIIEAAIARLIVANDVVKTAEG